MPTNCGTVSSSIKTLAQYEKMLNDENKVLKKKEQENKDEALKHLNSYNCKKEINSKSIQ